MKNRTSILILILTMLMTSFSYSQKKEQLYNINQDVWEVFTKAFETHDSKLFASIHSADLIRVSGNGKSIKTFNVYIESYEKRWKEITSNQTISFRFLERIIGENQASERGIYKLTINPNSAEEKSYYGKFHVILKKENEKWKLLVDNDSNENDTIDVHTYKSAFGLDQYDKY